MLDIRELLAIRGLDLTKRIKMARHQRYDIAEIVDKGLLEAYQRYQSKAKFDCDYVVSFVATEGTRARFFGVYRVGWRKPASEVPLPIDFPYPEFASPAGYYYQLDEVEGFEDLKNRVIVEWGKGAVSWAQKLAPREVVEITARDSDHHFPGYLDFILTYDELVDILTHPLANREWHTMLRAVAGVYLITDSKTGKQYVGSAYGAQGMLGRWLVYAKAAHADNKLLMELFGTDNSYSRNLRFTILQTLPKIITQTEATDREALYKRKLGTRAFGLNAN